MLLPNRHFFMIVSPITQPLVAWNTDVHQHRSSSLRAKTTWMPFSSRPARQLILVILGICQNCLVWTKEITTEVILFEYSRRIQPITISYRLGRPYNSGGTACPEGCNINNNNILTYVGHRADARSRGQKLCCGRLQRSLLGRYRPQSAMSCSTLRERAAWSSPSASQVSCPIRWRQNESHDHSYNSGGTA